MLSFSSASASEGACAGAELTTPGDGTTGGAGSARGIIAVPSPSEEMPCFTKSWRQVSICSVKATLDGSKRSRKALFGKNKYPCNRAERPSNRSNFPRTNGQVEYTFGICEDK